MTDAVGSARFTVPEGSYLLRVRKDGREYWSEVIHVLAYQDNPHSMALELLARHPANNPHPQRYDGKAPEYRPMFASIGPLGGMLNRATVNSEASVYYYVSDHLGTPQLLVDETGAVAWQGNYTPFGGVDIAVNTLDNEFRFPGQYFDTETGLHYNWNRYYDPATGRYITADPIGLEGGMNLYAYVEGNPVNGMDFMGLAYFAYRPLNGLLKPLGVFGGEEDERNNTIIGHEQLFFDDRSNIGFFESGELESEIGWSEYNLELPL